MMTKTMLNEKIAAERKIKFELDAKRKEEDDFVVSNKIIDLEEDIDEVILNVNLRKENMKDWLLPGYNRIEYPGSIDSTFFNNVSVNDKAYVVIQIDIATDRLIDKYAENGFKVYKQTHYDIDNELVYELVVEEE